MDQAGANQRTDATLLRLTRALDELAVAPAPGSAGSSDADRVRRFNRATGTAPATANGTPPGRSNGTALGPSPTHPDALDRRELALLADRLEQARTEGDAALAARVDDLAGHLRRVGNDGDTARAALDVLTGTVERHLQRLTQTRTALDGLAGVVERQRADAAPVGHRLATLETQLAGLQADGHRLATLETQLAGLQADGQDVVATLRAELAATAARTEELAGVAQRQAGQLTRLRAQVKALAPVKKADVTRATGVAPSQPASKKAAPKQTGARETSERTARRAR